MSFRRPSTSRIRSFLLAIVAMSGVAAAGACSLNPQPIPPGFEPDASTSPAPGDSDKGNGAAADASSADDAGRSDGDAADDSAPIATHPDAGSDAADAGDAGDASADAKDEG